MNKNPSLKNEMLSAVRTYLSYKLGITDIKPQLSDNEFYLKKTGIFVTLHKNGDLRGCIGHIVGMHPLKESLFEMAEASAFEDPRFNPIKKHELNEITIEISVLSELEEVSGVTDIEVGKHGVLLKQGYQQAVFLPQVAPEQGWDRDEMLSHLSMKAGLSPDAYKNPDMKFYIFTAVVFSEQSHE
ncbi:MAG TPA: AmmeMemoRadiSam system protein A [Candidatus Marinimicrobia bacterium]|nr:AmmeMemoRadiSam system protein A [Candidatus Neomarinimicrobiota bacterium]